MSTKESFLSRHLWWIGLSALDVLYVMLLPVWSITKAEILITFLFILAMNAYVTVVMIKCRRTDGRIPVRSQEFEAWSEWVFLTGLTSSYVHDVFFLPLSPTGRTFSEVPYIIFMFWVIVSVLINYSMRWRSDEVVVRDERGEQLDREAIGIAFVVLAATILFSPIVLVHDNGIGDSSQLDFGRLHHWLLACIFFSIWSGLTYVVYRYVYDHYANWKTPSREIL